MKLLIIDDEPHIRQMMRFTLEAGGYEVDEAGSGDEGLARFGNGAAYDAVVLDQKMPGLDGLETLRRIRERAPEARVLMATAFASIELAVDAMKLGAVDFLRKPMTPETLRGAVAAALVGHPAARPAAPVGGAAAAERPRIRNAHLERVSDRARRRSGESWRVRPSLPRAPLSGWRPGRSDRRHRSGSRGARRTPHAARAACRRRLLARAGRAAALCVL